MPAQAAAHRGEREQEAERGAQHADRGGQDQAVDEGRLVAGIDDGGEKRLQREDAFIDEGALQQVRHREEHEQQQQDPDRRNGAEQRRIGRDPAP